MKLNFILVIKCFFLIKIKIYNWKKIRNPFEKLFKLNKIYFFVVKIIPLK